MQTVVVSNVIQSKFCITRSSGLLLYDQFYRCVVSETQTEFDFSDIKIIATPFMNAAFGQLMKDFSERAVSDYIVCKWPEDKFFASKLLERVMKNSTAYYGNPSYQYAVDSVIKSLKG